MKPNVYLDIDGVLLANEHNLANHAEEFITYLIDNNYTIYWLTTHCMNGDPVLAVQNVGKLCSPKIQHLLKQIKPTSWKISKTEAIDFSKPFLWFDDDLYDDEKQELIKNGRLGDWIGIELSKKPNHLRELMNSFPVATEAS